MPINMTNLFFIGAHISACMMPHAACLKRLGPKTDIARYRRVTRANNLKQLLLLRKRQTPEEVTTYRSYGRWLTPLFVRHNFSFVVWMEVTHNTKMHSNQEEGDGPLSCILCVSGLPQAIGEPKCGSFLLWVVATPNQNVQGEAACMVQTDQRKK